MRGERLYDCCPGNRGSNISLIGALSLDGLIATMSLPGSVNTEVFMTTPVKVSVCTDLTAVKVERWRHEGV
jgi:hypothetical protein